MAHTRAPEGRNRLVAVEWLRFKIAQKDEPIYHRRSGEKRSDDGRLEVAIWRCGYGHAYSRRFWSRTILEHGPDIAEDYLFE